MQSLKNSRECMEVVLYSEKIGTIKIQVNMRQINLVLSIEMVQILTKLD